MRDRHVEAVLASEVEWKPKRRGDRSEWNDEPPRSPQQCGKPGEDDEACDSGGDELRRQMQTAGTGEEKLRRGESHQAPEQLNAPSRGQDGNGAESAEDRRTISHSPQR